MEEKIYLQTIKFENYYIGQIFFEEPEIIGENFIKDSKIKTISVDKCYKYLKNIGEKLYINSNKTIKFNNELDELFLSKNINKINEYYHCYFTQTLYSNVNYIGVTELINFHNLYGIQTLPQYYYRDKKLYNNMNNKFKGELLPLINVSLTIFFIDKIKNNIKNILISRNPNYYYKELEKNLLPYSKLCEYYLHNYVNIEDDCDFLKKITYHYIDDKLIKTIIKYIDRLKYIILVYLNIIELPKLTTSETKIESLNFSRNNYKSLNIKPLYIHHTVFYQCLDILFDDIDLIPKCDMCGAKLDSSKYLCCNHLMEYGNNVLKKSKNEVLKKQINNELQGLKSNPNYKTPTIDSSYSTKLKNKRYYDKKMSNQ